MDKAQADAYTDIQLAKTNLTAQYQNAVTQAKANNSIQLNTALYEELLRVQNLQRQDAQFAAGLAAEQQALVMKLAAEQEQLAIKLAAEQQALAMELAAEQQLQAMKSAAKGTSSSSSGGSKKYDNGSLTAEQVKAVQTFFGLTSDGFWGPDSKETTGLTADKAWDTFVAVRYYLGDTMPEMSITDVHYERNSGLFLWNNTAYTTLEKLVSAIKKAGLSQGKLASLQTVIQNFGFPGLKLTEGKPYGE